MAIKQTRIDDYDGRSEDAVPVFFSIQDRFFTLDLAPANLKKLEDAMKGFIEKAQPSEAPRGGRRSPASAYANGGEPEPQLVREWAQANGISVAEKGRVSQDIVERYKLAKAQEAQANK